MKRFLIALFCVLTCIVSVNAQRTKYHTTYYKESDIQGVWIATQGFNNKSKEWVEISSDNIFVLAFTQTKKNGRCIALMNNGNGISHFAYTFKANTITLYDLNDKTPLVFIKVMVVKNKDCMIGLINTTTSNLYGKFRLEYIDKE